MDVKSIKAIAKVAVAKTKFAIKKNSPELLLGAGIVGAVTGAVVACKETPKAIDIYNSGAEDLAHTHEVNENRDVYFDNPEEYTDKDYRKDIMIIYMQTGAKLIKNYAPAIVIGGASIASLLASHNLMKKRALALASAYAAVDTAFKEYRQRVVDKYGEEEDKKLRYGLTDGTETIEITDENGNTKKKKVKVIDANPSPAGMSMYARLFDEFNSPYQYNRSSYLVNESFVRHMETYMNDKLTAEGYLFLNDVYDALGMSKTDFGNVVGWIYDPHRLQDASEAGDNYVEFTIVDNRSVNGIPDEDKDPSMWIDFNVQGPIIEKFEYFQH